MSHTSMLPTFPTAKWLIFIKEEKGQNRPHFKVSAFEFLDMNFTAHILKLFDGV